MRLLRNAAYTVLLLIGAACTITFSSCDNDDDCEDVACQNGGVCIDGVCNCPAGYEGTRCEKLINSDTNTYVDFTGTYTATPSCNPGSNNTYTFNILADSATGTLTVTNLGNYKCLLITPIAFDGTFSGNTINISDTVCSNRMSATGTFNNGTLTIHYAATYPQLLGETTDSCTVTAVKQ